MGAQDMEMVSSSWPPIVGRVNALGNKSPNTLPFSSPDNQIRRTYDASTEYETLSLILNPPRVVIDNLTDPDATLVKVDSANRHGCLLEVVQVLTDLDLNISKATISSDGGWFVDVFHVKDHLNRKLEDQKLVDYIQQSLGAKQEVSVREVRTCLGRAVSYGSTGEFTALELTGTDRPGLLAEISSVLTQLGCNVKGAEVWTHNLRVACVVYINDKMTAKSVQDAALLGRIKAELGKVMRSDVGGNRAITDVSISQMHTERRLHQMMFADKDYEEPTPTGRRRLSESNDFQISIRNCVETKYSILDVRCTDRPKLLFDTVCTLTDMKYVVFHATVDSQDGIATQEFYIRHISGDTLDSEAERERVCKCLEAAIERRTPDGIRLELRTNDRVGLLSDVTRAFQEKGLSVTRADVATERDQVMNVFYVTDASGKPVDMNVVEALRQEIGSTVLQVKESPAIAIPKAPKSDDKARNSLVSMLRSHSERFLVSLGFGGSPSPPIPSPIEHLRSNAMATSTRW